MLFRREILVKVGALVLTLVDLGKGGEAVFFTLLFLLLGMFALLGSFRQFHDAAFFIIKDHVSGGEPLF